MTASSPIWTDTALAYLTEAWPAGKLTAVQIGRELENLTGRPVSKNAVLGKAWRMGLVRPPNARRWPHGRANGSEAIAAHREGEWPLLTLKSQQCRFACTPHDAEVHLFCGAQAEPGCPYCPRHARIAYRETDPIKDDERFAA